MPLMMAGQLPVAPFDTGTAALKEIGGVAGHLLQALTVIGGEGLEHRFGLTQRRQQRGDQGPQSPALRRLGGAFGHAVEINRGDRLFGERRFQRRGKIQGLDLGGQGGEEEGEGGQPLGGDALGFREALARSAGPVGGGGDLVSARPDGAKALRDLCHGLTLSGGE